MKSKNVQNIILSERENGEGPSKIFRDLNGAVDLSTITSWRQRSLKRAPLIYEHRSAVCASLESGKIHRKLRTGWSERNLSPLENLPSDRQLEKTAFVVFSSLIWSWNLTRRWSNYLLRMITKLIGCSFRIGFGTIFSKRIPYVSSSQTRKCLISTESTVFRMTYLDCKSSWSQCQRWQDARTQVFPEVYGSARCVLEGCLNPGLFLKKSFLDHYCYIAEVLLIAFRIWKRSLRR